MKIIKKICVAIAVITVLSCNVYATDSDVQDLTVEEAVNKAIKYSSTLKSIDENLKIADDNQDDTVRDYTLAEEGYDAYDLSAQLRSIRNQILNYELSADVEKLSINISVKQFFSTVLKAERDLELYDESLEISKKELKIAEVKYNLGLMSDTEYDSQQKSYQKNEMERDSKEMSISEAYISLNTVLGVSNLNTRYNLIMNTEYIPFEGGDVTAAINKALSVAQSVVTAERNYELAKYRSESYSSLTSSDTIEERKIAVNQASRSLTETKNSVEKNVQNLYNEIIKNENDYKSNLIELEELRRGLEILQVKYSLGKVTELEVEKSEYSIHQLEAEMENQVREHEVLTEKYSNPVVF